MTTPAGPGLTPEAGRADLERARRRARFLLVAGAAVGSTSIVMASTVAAIAVRDLLGGAALSGAGGAAMVAGVALGTSALATVIARRGQRVGLALGYATGAGGALLAAWAIGSGAVAALLVGLLLVGFANSSAALSRYASAEMAAPAQRASAISLVVWANTIGAVVGPVLIPLGATVAGWLEQSELAGPLLLSGLLSATSALLLLSLLRPDVRELARQHDGETTPPGTSVELRQVARRPTVVLALTAMIVGQVVMLLIMSMTPVHMVDHGHDLGAVGVVISAHILGMYALSPLSGRITDRIGDVAAVMASIAILGLAAAMSAIAPADGGTMLLAALFLLGYGWNLGFVAGSSLLTSSLAPHERTRAQGFADTLVWGSSAVGSLVAGLLLAWAGFAALGVTSLVLLALAAGAVLRLRSGLSLASAS